MKYDKYKPKILDWLSSLVNHKFTHHFSDKWINVHIWDNTVSISFDFRQKNQKELFDKLPDELKGCLQHGTNKLVNEKILYFELSKICSFEYPKIITYNLLKANKHQETEKGGWYIKGNYWYSYDWEIMLSDGSSIEYHNQVKEMDLKEDSSLFKTRIAEKVFYSFIEKFS